MCVCAECTYIGTAVVCSHTLNRRRTSESRTYTRLSESFIYRVQIKRDRVAGTEISLVYTFIYTNMILCRRDDDVIINTSRANRIRI